MRPEIQSTAGEFNFSNKSPTIVADIAAESFSTLNFTRTLQFSPLYVAGYTSIKNNKFNVGLVIYSLVEYEYEFDCQISKSYLHVFPFEKKYAIKSYNFHLIGK